MIPGRVKPVGVPVSLPSRPRKSCQARGHSEGKPHINNKLKIHVKAMQSECSCGGNAAFDQRSAGASHSSSTGSGAGTLTGVRWGGSGPVVASGGGGSSRARGGGACLLNAGAFFGQTTLGVTDPFADAATMSVDYPFHKIDPAAYEEV